MALPALRIWMVFAICSTSMFRSRRSQTWIMKSMFLMQKRQFLFIECMYNGEKGDAQRDAVSQELGIKDAVYFNKKADEMNEAGFPKAVDDFIAGL